MIIGYFIYRYSYNYFIDVFFVVGYIYLILLYFSHKKKEKELLEKEDNQKIASEKTRIAIEMHDDLGADLSNLLFKLRMYQNHYKSQNMEDYHEIENFTKSIIKKVNETIWTLNSEKDNVKSLLHFMLKFLDDYLTPKNISFEFNDHILAKERAISVEKRRNIFHLFKELVNLVTVTNTTHKISISLMVEVDILKLLFKFQNKVEIIDFEASLGEILKNKIDALSANYSIDRNHTEFTQITFEIPI